jgi:ribonuclease BN (tRNA processing enzyme)
MSLDTTFATDMTVTVLGSSASSPDAGNACAGYLVRQGGTGILLDCGPGVLGNLRRFVDVAKLDAIVISHFHPDHFLDLVPMRYGLRYGLDPDRATPRPRVLLPPGGIGYLRGVGRALRGNPAFFDASFDLAEFDPDDVIRIGGLDLTFCRTTHDEPTWAMAVRGDGCLVYTADTRASADLAGFAMYADLLLCEATYPASLAGQTAGSEHHLTSHGAGLLAREAWVRQLMLTHFWPGIDRNLFAEEAERAFGAPVTLARPGLVQPVVSLSASRFDAALPALQEV